MEISKISKVSKLGKYFKNFLEISCFACLMLLVYQVAYADQSVDGAVSLPMVDKLSATVKSSMNGPASLIIDGIIVAGGGYATAKTSTPAPLIFALVSAAIFELFTKIMFA